MEGLSVAASSIALISIAVQLTEGVKKLCDFWNSVKEAPAEIQRIIRELSLFSDVLSSIAHEAQSTEPDSLLTSALVNCGDCLASVSRWLEALEPSFTSKNIQVRKWSAFKTVWKEKQLSKHIENLDSLKSSLQLVILAQQRYVSLDCSLPTYVYVTKHCMIF